MASEEIERLNEKLRCTIVQLKEEIVELKLIEFERLGREKHVEFCEKLYGQSTVVPYPGMCFFERPDIQFIQLLVPLVKTRVFDCCSRCKCKPSERKLMDYFFKFKDSDSAGQNWAVDQFCGWCISDILTDNGIVCDNKEYTVEEAKKLEF